MGGRSLSAPISTRIIQSSGSTGPKGLKAARERGKHTENHDMWPATAPHTKGIEVGHTSRQSGPRGAAWARPSRCRA